MSVHLRRFALVVAMFVTAGGAFVASMSAAAAYPPGTGPTCALSVSTAEPGQSLRIDLRNYDPSTVVTVSFHSAPVTLATLTTNSSGAASGTVTIPSDATAGGHVMVATQGSNNSTCPITVSGAGTNGGGGGTGGGGGGLSSTGVAVLSIGGLGLLLIFAGGLALVAGRRRQAIAA